MHRLYACALLLACACQASEDTAHILEHAREAVAAQLARAANYACVQTTDRQYFVTGLRTRDGCALKPLSLPESLLMRDRLRLDLAVSEGREIYSWHAAARFTSSEVSDVVRTGPISSGNFIGFLDNIFLGPRCQFTYTGEARQNGARTYNFTYVVPLAQSAYHVITKGGKPVVPFHGSFSIDASNYQVTSLQVVTDAIPADSPICSAVTTITYQIVSISGHHSMIPATFVLDIKDNADIHTISSSQYSQCREFRGESTLLFRSSDASLLPSIKPAKVDEWLPAGIALHIGLRTTIDEGTSYIGDPVQGVLLRKLKVPGTATTLPKGAILDGVITNLEDHYQPEQFQIFTLSFTRLSFGQTSFLLKASPKTSNRDRKLLREVYGSPLPPRIEEDERRGLFVMVSPHVHLDRHFSGQWITGTRPVAEAGSSRPQ